MSDQFLAIPDQMIGATMFSQEAVDWLAFGPPEQGTRSSLSLDDQIACAHSAAGTLQLAMWGGELPAYVHSPSIGIWYQIPARYWGRPTREDMQLAAERPELPDRLPGQPRPLDPRYGIEVPTYPHRLPAGDLVGQVVAFRKAEIERYCSIVRPVFTRRARQGNGEAIGKQWSLYEAVAWLASGDLNLVERQQRVFADEQRKLGDAGALTWITLQRAVPGSVAESPDIDRVTAAVETLRAACEDGIIRATGIPADRGDRRGIPRDDFIGAELWPGKGGCLHRIVAGRGEPARWFELRFSQDDVHSARAVFSPLAASKALESRPDPYPSAPAKPIERWSEGAMTEAIRTWTNQNSSRDRDRAWRDHFKALAAEHGWDNRSFRDHWSTALGSVGQPGRTKSAQ